MPKRRGPKFEGSALHEAILWALALKIAVLILVFDPFAAQAFDLPKSLASRVVEWIIAALLLATVARYGATVLPRTRLHVAVGALLAVNVLAAVFAEDRYLALYGDRDRYLGLTFVVDMVVLYLAAAVALRRPSDWLFVGGTVGIAALVAVGYGFIQAAGRDPFPWAADPRFRPFATFGNPDMFGQFLSLGLGASSAAIVCGSPFGARRTRVIGLAVSAVFLLAAAVTATRSVALALAAIAVGLVAIYFRISGVRRATVRTVAIVAVPVLAAGVVALAVTPLGTRLVSTFASSAQVQDRLLIYGSALAMIGDAPLLGHGVDGFAVAYPRYRSPDAARVEGVNIPQSSAHSWPLQAAATTGLAGLAALLAAIVVSGWLLFSVGLRSAPWIAGPLLVGFAAYLAAGLVSPGAVAVDWFPWLVFGGTVGLVGTRAAERQRPLRAWAGAILVAIVVVGILSNYFAAAANRELYAAQESWRAKRGLQAVGGAQAATRDDAGRPDNWNWLGLAWELQKDDFQARNAYAEAARRAPHVATFRMNEALALARSELSSHRSAADAIALAKQAVASDPNEPSLYANLANIQTAAGQNDDAVQVLVRALQLYPQGVTLGWDKSLVEAALAAGDLKNARRGVADAAAFAETAVLRAGEARLALRDGDISAARTAALRALALDPQNQDAAAVLKQIGG